MRNHIINEIVRLAETDSRVILLTGDLGFKVLEKFSNHFPDRYINCGIAEQNMASIAAGMAKEGDVVFIYSIGNFPTLRCMEQIRNDICYHNANVKIMAVGGGFTYGAMGMTHHATEDFSMMRTLPNMRVYAPADPGEAVSVFRDAFGYEGPCYIRLARGADPDLHLTTLSIDPILIEKGSNVVILTTGTILSEGQKAIALLQEKGIDAALYSCPCIKPIDKQSINDIAEKYDTIVTLEENQLAGGFGSAILEVLEESGSAGKVRRIGLRDTFASVVGDQNYLRSYYGIDCNAIVNRIIEILNKQSTKTL